jgi:nucleoside-diphosphate-sugar epimerase
VAVEQALLAAVPNSVAFRASIVIAAQSRSFRFLVRLIERLPALVVPSWGAHRTYPVDGRDVIDYLARAAAAPEDAAGSYDAIGPDVMSYAEMLERIASHMLVDRPTFSLPFNLTPVASVVAAGVAGEDVGLIGPLMESLDYDLLPRDERAAETFGVRLHSFDAAVERSLREWESVEEVRAR